MSLARARAEPATDTPAPRGIFAHLRAIARPRVIYDLLAARCLHAPAGIAPPPVLLEVARLIGGAPPRGPAPAPASPDGPNGL